MPPERDLDRRMSDLALAIDDLTHNSISKQQLNALTDAVHDAANQLMTLNEIGDSIKSILERIAVALEASPDRLEAIAENLDKIWDDFGWAIQNDRLRPTKEEPMPVEPRPVPTTEPKNEKNGRQARKKGEESKLF